MPRQCLDCDITIDPAPGQATVTFNGRTIASSSMALSLKDPDYPPVIYFPMNDVDQDVLTPSEHRTTSPFKGDASYFDLNDGEATAENAVWTYPEPCPLVEMIRGHVAFWGDDVKISV